MEAAYLHVDYAENLAYLYDVLSSLGITVNVSDDFGMPVDPHELDETVNGGMKVSFYPPSERELKERRTRNAGRKSKEMDIWGNDSVFKIDTTCAEFLEWRETHTVAECMDVLGIKSRSTYFRTLKAIQDMEADETWTRQKTLLMVPTYRREHA